MSPGKENVRASSSKDKLENNLEGFFQALLNIYIVHVW